MLLLYITLVVVVIVQEKNKDKNENPALLPDESMELLSHEEKSGSNKKVI